MHLSNISGPSYVSFQEQLSSPKKPLTFSKVKKLIDEYPGVISLEVPSAAKMQDRDLKWVLRHDHCQDLLVLNISGSSTTDKGMKELAKGFPKLGGLNVSNCVKLTNKSLRAVSKGCPGLTHLNLSNCEKITDKGLEALRSGCPNLIELNVIGCPKITENELEQLHVHYPRLQIHRA